MVLSDLTARRREFHFWVACAPEHLLKDQRDWPVLHLYLNIMLVSVPAAVVLLEQDSHVVGAVYFLMHFLLFEERFMLCMHYMSHTGLFRWAPLDWIVHGALSPLFGIPPGLYHLHHVVMHHGGNNRSGRDLSSTERYQRDNVVHFITYWLRFALFIWFELPMFAVRRRRYRQAATACAGMALFWAGSCVLFAWKPAFVVWALWVPVLASSVALALGNWAQHLFIDPANSRSSYGSAYCIVNTPANQRTLNDGYHIEHHLNPTRHWSELPGAFIDNRRQYEHHDCVAFKSLDFIRVCLLVFAGDYNKLSRHLVRFRPRGRSEVERFLRARLAPVA